MPTKAVQQFMLGTVWLNRNSLPERTGDLLFLR